MPTANAPAAAGAMRYRRSAGTIEQINILTCRKRSLDAISKLVVLWPFNGEAQLKTDDEACDLASFYATLHKQLIKYFVQTSGAPPFPI